MRKIFQDKVVLVTGGASGIGKIMVRKALERGAKQVVIWDINTEGMQAVSEEFVNLGKVISVQVDLGDTDSILKAVEQTKMQVQGVAILINNVGIVVGKKFEEHTHGDISKTMRINTEALMHTTKSFLPEMLTNNDGAICNIASSAGLISNPKMSVYAASKWAVVGWSDSLRLEMEQQGRNISVTTIMPYYINTGMFDGVKSKLIPILEPEKTTEKIMKAIERKKTLYALPMPYRFIRLNQGLFSVRIFDWIMDKVFGVYDSMNTFKGRK